MMLDPLLLPVTRESLFFSKTHYPTIAGHFARIWRKVLDKICGPTIRFRGLDPKNQQARNKN